MNLFRLRSAFAWGCLCLSALAAGARADTISALGSVLPAGGVIDVFAPAGEIVDAVPVREGEWVEEGAILARLRSLPAAVARLELAQAQAAASAASDAADIALAQGRLKVAEEEARIDEERLQRVIAVKGNAMVSPEKIEDRELARNAATIAVEVAREAVARAVRTAAVDRRVSAGKLDEMRAAIAEREIRAPVKSRVLKLLTQRGASTNQGSLMKLGDTTAMIVLAEIFEEDALKVRPGQKALIASPALPRKFAGSVVSIGPTLFHNQLQKMDPGAQTSSHVVEAIIRLDDREPMDRLIYLNVDVTIER